MRFSQRLLYRLQPERMLGAIGMQPDDWQSDLLRSQAQRVLLNCSRQVGKSSTAAALALWGAIYEPGLILVVSPSLRQSQELFRRILTGYRMLERPVRALSETKLTLELVNGARIVSLPGNEARIRSYSGVRLLIFEEASRIPDALYAAMRPMLATSGGRILLLSTPFGARGFFYEEYKVRQEWQYIQVAATECKRIPASFLEEERRKIGDWWYEQEYACQFKDPLTAVFRTVDIEHMVDKEMAAWHIPLLSAA